MNGHPLASLAVHDLKNALGSLEAMLERLVTEPDAASARRAWLHCADLRRRLVSVLTLHGDGAGPLQPHTADEDPRAVLHSLAARYAQTLERPIALDVGPCATAPAFFYFDRHLVRMALESALHNACRYARHAVQLDARAEADALVFTIDDDGPGPDATPPEDSSTRLGTELCAAVARAHGHGQRIGRVKLSRREAGGARFEMWLY